MLLRQCHLVVELRELLDPSHVTKLLLTVRFPVLYLSAKSVAECLLFHYILVLIVINILVFVIFHFLLLLCVSLVGIGEIWHPFVLQYLS